MWRFTLALLISSPALFALEWPQHEIEATAAPTDTFYTAIFAFKNTSARPVEIRSVFASCGCTSAALAKQRYEPGESGEITAVFQFQGRVGRQEKIITVTTDEDELTTTELRLVVNIPEILTLTPSTLTWKLGEVPGPQTVKIEVMPGLPRLTLAVDTIPMFPTELKPLDPEGRVYELRITPMDADEPRMTVLIVRTEYPAGAERAFPFEVRVE